MGSMSAGTLAVRDRGRGFEVQLALGWFLAGHSGNTRLAYEQDLRTYVSWCQRQRFDLFEVRRTHIELFARWLEHRGAAGTTVARRLSTVAGFYRYCGSGTVAERRWDFWVILGRLRNRCPGQPLRHGKRVRRGSWYCCPRTAAGPLSDQRHHHGNHASAECVAR